MSRLLSRLCSQSVSKASPANSSMGLVPSAHLLACTTNRAEEPVSFTCSPHMHSSMPAAGLQNNNRLQKTPSGVCQLKTSHREPGRGLESGGDLWRATPLPAAGSSDQEASKEHAEGVYRPWPRWANRAVDSGADLSPPRRTLGLGCSFQTNPGWFNLSTA